MKNPQRIVNAMLATTLGFTVVAHAETDFWQALTGGKVSGSFRLRSESVDDSVNKNAHALTLRTRLGYTSVDYHGLSATLEFDDTRVVAGQDRYSPESPGFAQIADPRVTEMNQAFIRYQTPSGVAIKAGRQRILLDNQRFVGAVGWRQDDQTFDALNIDYAYRELKMTYAYIDKVNGITPAFDADASHHIANLGYTWTPALVSTLYGYRLDDNDALADASKDSRTLGLRLTGKTSAGALILNYAAEFARQSTRHFDADYLLTEFSVGADSYGFTVGYENLGSDAGVYGFQTPLATKHAFNGWTDKFANTPNDGLRDSYAKITFSPFDIDLTLSYHRFKADKGSASYGDEIDVMAAYTFNKHLSAGIKYADYRADTFSADTQKFWLWAEVTF